MNHLCTRRRSRARIRTLATAAFMVAAASLAMPGHATEGGGLGIYPDGLENFLSGALPPPGLHPLLYGSYASYDKLRNNNGDVTPVPGFSVDVGVVAPRLVWVTGQQLLGGQLAFHAIAPLLDVRFKAAGASYRNTGLGDVAFGPALGFHASPSLHYVVAVDFIAPTGRYDKTDPASLGKNYWTVQPIVALSTIDPTGLNVDVKAMLDINRKNSDTQTTSGKAFHADYALGWGFGAWAAGLGGHVFRQLEADSGPNAAAGKAQAVGIGPSLRYTDGKGVLFTAKLQKEFSVKNRPQGTQLFVKASMPF